MPPMRGQAPAGCPAGAREIRKEKNVESKIITVRVPCVIRGEEAARLQAEADRQRAERNRAEARKRDQAWGEAMADRLQLGGICLLCGMVIGIVYTALGVLL